MVEGIRACVGLWSLLDISKRSGEMEEMMERDGDDDELKTEDG
jgi:hypothetical protein